MIEAILWGVLVVLLAPLWVPLLPDFYEALWASFWLCVAAILYAIHLSI